MRIFLLVRKYNYAIVRVRVFAQMEALSGPPIAYMKGPFFIIKREKKKNQGGGWFVTFPKPWGLMDCIG